MDKIKARSATCRQNGWRFVPFVMETVGSWGGKAQHLLQPLIRRWAFHHQISMAQAAGELRTRLQLTLICELGRQLERGYPAGGQDDDSPPVDLFG